MFMCNKYSTFAIYEFSYRNAVFAVCIELIDFEVIMQSKRPTRGDVDVVDLRAQADASMPACNNNVNYTTQLNSTGDYGRRCLTPLCPHHN